MKDATLCTVNSQRGKIFIASIDVKNKEQNPMTKILIEVPTSDFDFKSIQINDEISKNNVNIKIEGYVFTSEKDNTATRDATMAEFDEYVKESDKFQ